MKVTTCSSLTWAPASHEDPKNPGVYRKVLATRDQFLAGRVQMLNWARLPVGASFQRHFHEDMEEVFMISVGQARMETPQGAVDLLPGDCVIIEPREVHQLHNTGDVDVFYFVFGNTLDQGGKTVVVP